MSLLAIVNRFVPFESISGKQAFINFWMWLLLFLQLGVMLVFASWNSREVGSMKWFGGIYTDINKNWF
jgi:hypothetical protein